MSQRYRTTLLRGSATFWLLVENILLKMAVALQQLQEACLEARLKRKGFLTAWRLWRELRREHHLGMRLFRLGWHLVPQDRDEFTAVCRAWEESEPPQEIQAELLDRLSRFAPDHQWDLGKAQRVGGGTGLTPEALLQLLRERQKDTGGASKH